MTEPTQLLHSFPVVTEIAVAWGEMDAYQHVNNIVYFRYFESARIAYFSELDWSGRDGQVGMILASTSCVYKFPLTFPDRVRVGATITSVQDDRCTMRYRAVSERHSRIAAEGEGVVVAYDYAVGRKALIPADVREGMTALEQGRV